ncbi:MAG: hypothetical protein OEY14_18270 [Myxococcales bacterium]|nr:hypothetical protein [Myxococcales bacterium]
MSHASIENGDEPEQPFGRDTIMEPALASRHGIAYVHLACFAIDIDRIRESVEEDPEGVWPFGWEVFLLEIYLLGSLDPELEEDRLLIEDACRSVMEQPPGQSALGSQLPFAVYDAIIRGEWPESLKALFAPWRDRAGSLVEDLAPLWREPEAEAADLALACLEHAIEPPLAPPTEAALEAMVESLVGPESDPSASPPEKPSPGRFGC